MNILINSGRTKPFLTTRRKLITSIILKGHKVILTGYQKGYEKEIGKMGASFIPVPLNRTGFNPFKDINLLIKYYKIIKKENIDIVHSYTIKPNIYGSIAARLSGIKKIYPTLNGIGYAFTGYGMKANVARFFASLLYRIAFRSCEKIFFHNKDDINLMVDRHLAKRDKCVLTFGSGIDLDYYRVEKMPDSISFILISRLLIAKGILEYIQAAQKVKQKYPDIIFKLLGPTDPNPTGTKLKDIQSYIDDNIVEYYGENTDVRPFLKGSSVFVLPSYREGLPHTVLEAMAIGRAIITTDVPGCRETVINGENGFLVKPKCVGDLVDKMIWMIENPEKVKEMGKKSAYMAKKYFDVNIVNSIITSNMGV
ncbi:MAG: glycosyltransferase family 4 protein [Candidatus Helarchaeota archaeon]